MRQMKGKTVRYDWISRSEESKTNILDQLRCMITELRLVPPPKGASVSSIDGGPIYDCRLPARSFWGPYGTVREFHEALIDPITIPNRYSLPNFPRFSSSSSSINNQGTSWF